jgi:hypothetical protein
MRKLIPVLILAAFLATAGRAAAWDGVTVELSAIPSGLGPGDAWNATMTVIGPDGRPFAGERLDPAVTIRSEGGAEHVFPAGPASQPGVYEVTVVFPEAGTWSYRAEIVSGDLQAPNRAYPPVEIGAAPAGFPTWPVVGGLLSLLVLAAALVVGRSRLAKTGSTTPAAASSTVRSEWSAAGSADP